MCFVSTIIALKGYIARKKFIRLFDYPYNQPKKCECYILSLKPRINKNINQNMYNRSISFKAIL